MPRGLRKIKMKIDNIVVRYAIAESSILGLLARMTLAGTLGDPAAHRAARASVRRILRDLDALAIPSALRLVEEAYRLGARTGGGSGHGKLKSQALKLLNDSLEGRLTDATVHVGRRVDDIFRKEGLRAASLVLGGENVDNASQGFVNSLQRGNVSSFRDSNGREWALEDYAQMAMRTTISEAVFHGTEIEMLSKGLDVVAVNSVDNPCERCVPYDGKTFSLTGGTPGLLRLDIAFPIHPQCQHYISPVYEQVAA